MAPKIQLHPVKEIMLLWNAAAKEGRDSKDAVRMANTIDAPSWRVIRAGEVAYDMLGVEKLLRRYLEKYGTLDGEPCLEEFRALLNKRMQWEPLDWSSLV